MNKSGQAFPTAPTHATIVDGDKEAQHTFHGASLGITLRQFYAAFAMAGALASEQCQAAYDSGKPTDLMRAWAKNNATQAFMVADAMLAVEASERKEETP